MMTSRVVLCDLDNFKLRPLLQVTPPSGYAPLLQSADRPPRPRRSYPSTLTWSAPPPGCQQGALPNCGIHSKARNCASQPSCVDGMGMTQQVSKSRSRICGPRVIYVCSDGLRLQGELFSVGSGSPYACSILDSSVFWGMSAQEATEVAREAVFCATYRDAYSGNNVDLYHVTAKGGRRRERENLKEEYYSEKERERKRMAERDTEKKAMTEKLFKEKHKRQIFKIH